MKAQVLNAVAYPPKMLLVPVEMAGMNIAIHVAIFVVSQVVSFLHINPILIIASIAVTHGFLIYVAMKEPHVVSLIQATQRRLRTSRNLFKTNEGVKYVP